MAILPNGLNLSQAFIGNSEVQSAWLGNTKIWEKQGGILPVGYTQLQYVSSDGRQYITDVLPSSAYTYNDTVRVVATFKSTSTDAFLCLFGTQAYTGVFNRFLFVQTTSTEVVSTIGYGYWQSSMLTTLGAFNTQISVDISAKNGSQIIKVGSTTVATTSFALSGNTISMPLFCADTDELSRFWIGDLYNRFSVYLNGTLYRDLIPCKNPSNVVGLYDLVHSTFMHSESGTELIAGTPV